MAADARPLALALLLGAASASRVAHGHQQDPIELSGPLAAYPCKRHGDIQLTNGHVAFGETVSCQATDGEVRLQNVVAERGSSLRVSAVSHGTSEPGWAETACSVGDLDCNPCAFDVQAQFEHLYGKNLPAGAALVDDEKYYWTLEWDDGYEPSGHEPKHSFYQELLDYHFQGFVRTNSWDVPFAGTYSQSEGDTGSIFFVNGPVLSLGALHDAWTHHPSGISALGGFVLFGDYTSNSPHAIRFIPVSDPEYLQATTMHLFVPPFSVGDETKEINAGGGVGMAKLASGGYLLVSTGPGGPSFTSPDKYDPKPRYTDFHYLRPSPNGAATALAPLGTMVPASGGQLDLTPWHVGRWTQVNGDGASQKKYQYSENLTVITECETGDVYVIHASQVEPHALDGPGYWRLSRVGWEGELPRLEPLDVFEQNQNLQNCHIRSAATGWVNPNHQIELYCHDYRVGLLEDEIGFRRRYVDYGP